MNNRRYGFSIGRILHPTDFSHGSEIAFAHALRLTCAIQGSLSVLHVDRDQKEPDWDKFPSVRETLGRWKLLPPDASTSDVGHLGVHIRKSSVSGEDPSIGILSYLERHPADLIVLATHQRHGLDRWMHQTIAGTINQKSDSATLFIPYGCNGFIDEVTGESRLKRILIPVDHHPEAVPAVELTVDLIRAVASGPCEVRLLYVGDAAAAPAVRLVNEDKAHWKWVHRTGGVVQAILNEAKESNTDLIALTTMGRHGFLDALRGSTTEQIVEHTGCPVLAVHAWTED